LWSHLGL